MINESTLPLVYKPDYNDTAYLYMRGQDRNKQGWYSCFQATAQICQMVEDCIFDLVEGMQLDYASDAMLDRWGAIVGQQRYGMVDADYRNTIQARIKVNNCECRIDQITEITSILTGGSGWITSDSPMIYSVNFIVQNISSNMQRVIIRNLFDTKPAGVKLLIRQGAPSALVLADYTGNLETPDGYITRLDLGIMGDLLQ